MILLQGRFRISYIDLQQVLVNIEIDMRYIICGIILVAIAFNGWSQSAVLVRNNSWLDLEVSITQTGSHTLDPSEWSQSTNRIIPWAYDQAILSVDRDSAAIPTGDSIFLAVQLVANGDTAKLMFRLDGTSAGSTLDYAAELPSITDNWWDDGNFHEIQGALGGLDIVLKYRPENGDGNMDRDVLFVIHQRPAYSVNPADANDPNTLNVVNYNVQFLPFFIGGFDNGTRAPLIPLEMDPDLDVVVIEEAFDPFPRDQDLTPAMQAQGFIYDTGILNDYFPFNGGVIIYSRWPIEVTDEYDFQLCGPTSGDCFANKGIKYAKINKLGKSYHIFGTHMDAGSDPDDLIAKNLQFAEMRDFIGAQDIAPNEPAIYCGDFNVRATSIDLFNNMLDSLNPLLPEYQGYWSSTMSTDTGSIIDHAWLDRRYLIPMVATNEILTLRSIEDDMWEISDLSDHRTSWGRFSFPDIEFEPVDTSLCPGDGITFSVAASGAAFSYQWHFNGTPISGATGPDLVLTNIQSPDIGNYSCMVSYQAIHGTKSDPVNILFYPNGPDTVSAALDLEGWAVNLDCGVATEDEAAGKIQLFPNPTSGELRLEIIDLPPDGSLRIRDAHGVIMVEKDIKGKQIAIDLSSLSPGIYLTEIKAGNELITRKVVVR